MSSTFLGSADFIEEVIFRLKEVLLSKITWKV